MANEPLKANPFSAVRQTPKAPAKAAAPAAPKATPSAPKAAEPAPKVRNDATADEPLFFDGTITKMRKNDDGEWQEVLSDNLYPGEKLKSEWDQERAQAAVDKAANQK